MAPWSTTSRALVVVGTFGLVWAHAIGLTRFVDPTDIDWMFEGDWQAMLFGWLFTRAAPWSLPLAQAPGLLYPHGSSTALTDAVPLLSVLGKLLSPLFGERFQLHGLWMVSGVVGTGVAGVLVSRPHLRDAPSLTLAGLLFVMNPVVTSRVGHPPFFALWMLLGLVGLCFWPLSDARTARRVALGLVGIEVLICSVTAYLAVMGAVVMAGGIWRVVLSRRLSWREALGWLLAAPTAALGTLWAFGFVAGATGGGSAQIAVEGFGEFSADLLALINPMGWSRYVPTLGMRGRQYEGFSYLGLGVFALLLLRLALLRRHRPSRASLLTALPVLLALTLTTIYSWSNIVTVGGVQVADFSSFYERLGQWPSVFRSSGRFMWPLYLALTLSAVTAARHLGASARVAVLFAAVVVQLTDVNPLRANLHRQWPHFTGLTDPAWRLLGNDYRHLLVHPVQIQWTCPFDEKLVAGLSWEAYTQGLTINSGHVGRAPPGTDCHRHLREDELNDDTVYVPYFPQYFADLPAERFICGRLDGRRVCVSRARDTAFARALAGR